MKLNKLIFSLFLLPFIAFSQSEKSIDTLYSNYFKSVREIPYLHLNKTTLHKGENLWIQGYVLNLNSQKLHKNTTNLYCSIYNEDGSFKDQKLFFVKDGVTSGNIEIDSTYTNSFYYIKASTNWMKNFEEDESFVQKIQIVGNNHISKKESKSSQDYDLQLMPEGGHFLADIENTLGIIIKDYKNKGSIASGKIIDESNNIITTFNTDSRGIGKSTFFYEENKEYTAILNLEDGQIVSKKIPAADPIGVIITSENKYTKYIKISVKTNKKTLPLIKGDTYRFLIHNTNSYTIKKAVFNDDKTVFDFYIDTYTFKKGVNIITLFNKEMKPISERLIFNYKKSLFEKIDLDVQKADSDSLFINVNKEKKDNLDYFLSASFLPVKNKTYNPKNSIISKFLLKPFIKGDIENSHYYFTNINRKKLIDLDNLLLTQGWSKYSWTNIFNNPPSELHKFEKGISLKGGINFESKEKLNTIAIFSKESNLFLIEALKGKKFSSDNLFLKENSEVNLAFMGKKKLEKPKAYLSILPRKQKSSLASNYLQFSFELDSLKTDIDSHFEDSILLDEIKIEAKVKQTNNTPINMPGSHRYFKIDENSPTGTNVLDFIDLHGFRVIRDGFQIRITNRRATNRPGSNSITRPFVYLDGIEIGLLGLDILQQRMLTDFEEIFISKSFNGQIHLFSKKGYNEEVRKKNQFFSSKIDLGFSVHKEFYQSKYTSTRNDFFKNYGTIFWKSNIIIEKQDLSTQFKISTLNQNEIKTYIEGITSDGKLILQEKIISNE